MTNIISLKSYKNAPEILKIQKRIKCDRKYMGHWLLPLKQVASLLNFDHELGRQILTSGMFGAVVYHGPEREVFISEAVLRPTYRSNCEVHQLVQLRLSLLRHIAAMAETDGKKHVDVEKWLLLDFECWKFVHEIESECMSMIGVIQSLQKYIGYTWEDNM